MARSPRVLLVPLGMALAAGACSGRVGRPEPDLPAAADPQPGVVKPGASAAPAGCEAPTRQRLRRLTHDEYVTVVADLFGAPVDLLAEFPPDTRADGFGGDADGLAVTGSLADAYARASEQAARQFPVGRLAPCAQADVSDAAAACAVGFTTSFARRAYGRPLSPEESARLGQVYAAGVDGGRYDDGVRLVVEAVLQSPHFLYRTELGAGAASASGARLDGWETASALSFLLTGGRPDDELLDAAAQGALATPEQISREAKRLLARPRARNHLREFLRQWLEVDDVHLIAKAPDFVDFPSALRAEMDAEVKGFLDAALAEGGLLENVFGATSSFVGPALAARVYVQPGELRGPASDGTRAVPLDPQLRRGILALPGFLATHASVDRTSPIHRGLAILDRLLCVTIPDPPPALAIAPLDSFDRNLTTRQKSERHAQEPCLGCHRFIDPIGFGLEQMDLIGRVRTEENGRPIDSHGRLVQSDVDGEFVGPAALDEKLARSGTVRACFVEHLYRWAEARVAGGGDACALGGLKTTFAPARTTIDDLLLAYVGRPAFVARKADE